MEENYKKDLEIKKIKNKLYIVNKYKVGGGATNICNQLYNKNKNESFIAASDIEEEDNINMEDGSKNIFKTLFNYTNYSKLKKFIKKQGIKKIYVHNIFPQLSPSIFLAFKTNDVKVYYTLHQYDLVCPNFSLCNTRINKLCSKCVGKKIKWNILTNRCSMKGRKYDIAKCLISLIKFFLKIDQRITYYIVPSEFLKRQLILDGVNESKIRVIENFVSHKLWIQNYNKYKKETLIYFGRFSPEKNVLLLLKVIKELLIIKPNIILYLIGSGQEKERYQKYIKEEKLDMNIKIIDRFLSPDELKIYLNEMKVSILPSSVYESFGLTIIESIFANVIPIATNIGGMKETIEKSYGFTFENNNINDLKEKILYILENYNYELEKMLAIKEKIKEQYSITRYMNKLEEVEKI